MEITKLAPALVKAQSELKNPAMSGRNPHYTSKFAPLDKVRDAIFPVFNSHGLAIIQRGVECANGIGINTLIIHESGETLDAGTISIPVSKTDAQAYMSAVTYARRYGLQTAAGICGDPDDDGTGASGKETEPEPKKEVAKPVPSKPKQEAKPEAPKDKKAPSGGDIKWFQLMTECKKALGEEEYRRILGVHGATSSKEINDRTNRKACYDQMTAQIKANAEAKMGAE